MRPELGRLHLSKTARRVFGTTPDNVRRRSWGRWTAERDTALIAGYPAARKAKTLAALATQLSQLPGDGKVEIADLYKRASRLGVT